MAFPKLSAIRPLLVLLAILVSGATSHAFSLLGPFAPWMTPSVGFIKDPAFDVGGPRDINDEFRWNLPLLTYGFDDEFKNFFGPQGIAEVEKAIDLLRNLPPASQIDLSTAKTATIRVNVRAQSAELYDLRTSALAQLIEQLGLATPNRNIWLNTDPEATRSSEEESFPNDYVLRRNFDPITLMPSPYINGIRFSYAIIDRNTWWAPYPANARIASIYLADPTLLPFIGCVANNAPNFVSSVLSTGEFFSGLTRDDLGGLRYLLDNNNVNTEPLVPGVRAHDGASQLVSLAPRPGVNHIDFQRFDPGSTQLTNIYDDIFIEGGLLKTQKVERLISTPDILFTAANHPRVYDVPAFISRIGPFFSHQETNGSGILLPGAVISFEKLGDIYHEVYYQDLNYDYVVEPRWSSFTSITPNPTIYPVGDAYQSGRTLSVRPISTNSTPALEWKLRLVGGESYAIESSSDLNQWALVTNIVALPIHNLTNSLPTTPQFFRVRRLPHP